MKNFYRVQGYGNYSISCGWDGGLNLLKPEKITIDDAKDYNVFGNCGEGYVGFCDISTNIETCKKVQVAFETEYNGSRNVDLVVVAESEEEAKRLAEEYAEKYYPVKDEDGD